MADFTKTITNSLNLFGNGPSTKWGQSLGVPYTMAWGTATWGEGFSLPLDIQKLIANSIAPDTTLITEFQKVIQNIISIESDPTRENLSQGIWNYIFISNTTDGEDRVSTTWSEGNASAVSFTCMAAGTTNWS